MEFLRKSIPTIVVEASWKPVRRPDFRTHFFPHKTLRSAQNFPRGANRPASMGNSSSKQTEAEVDSGGNVGLTLDLSAVGEDKVKAEKNRIRDDCQHIRDIPYEEYEYPFENIAFEGGGIKGCAYIGAYQVLEELGIELKRFAGSSAGALKAALFAVGYSSYDVAKVLDRNLAELMLDHSCGCCSLLPNVLRHYGWNPATSFENLLGSLINDKLGSPDITFKQLYQMTGKELCVTAVNINMLTVDYFHPKTTPDVPIKLAVRMSMSIPGLFQAVKLKNSCDEEDVYVDGGLLCNYPLHVYDGWWLSMKSEDCFLNRIQPLHDWNRLMQKKERFGTVNKKTLGFLVYSAAEQEVMRESLESRVGLEFTDWPTDSELYKTRKKKLQPDYAANEEHAIFMESFGRFLKVLKEVNSSGDNIDDVIDKQELKTVLDEAVTKDSEHQGHYVDTEVFCRVDREILFGENADLGHIFDSLDENGDGMITFDELFKFIERSGIEIKKKHQGYSRKEVTSVGQFFEGVQDTLLTNLKYLFLQPGDTDRTVGINTDYIETNDFGLASCDREFLIRQGRRATISFLKHYVHNNNLPKKVITTSTLPQTTPIPPVNHITESQQATDGDDHVSMNQTTTKVDAEDIITSIDTSENGKRRAVEGDECQENGHASLDDYSGRQNPAYIEEGNTESNPTLNSNQRLNQIMSINNVQ